LWLFSFVEDESTELPLDRLPLGDLGHLVPFVRGLENVPNFFGTLESAFISSVSFDDLDDNTFKGLTSLLSVEQEIQYDEHT
jgi:hypothetical protein